MKMIGRKEMGSNQELTGDKEMYFLFIFFALNDIVALSFCETRVMNEEVKDMRKTALLFRIIKMSYLKQLL